jgi:hypothetical protein
MFPDMGRFLATCGCLILLLVGCSSSDFNALKFGDNYDDQSDRQVIPLDAISKWLGAPLPGTNFSDLRYKIIGDTPDPQAKISVKVPETYYKKIVENMADYDRVKNEFKNFDLVKPREWKSDDSFIKKPLPSTKIWVSKTGTYRRYIWYQDSVLYLVYASQ